MNRWGFQKRHTGNNGGFSLVELIVCIAILAVAAIPLYQSMSLSAKTNAKAQSKQNATSLAEEVMEEIKSSSIYDLKARYNGLSGDVDAKTGKSIPNEKSLGMDETGFWIDDTKNGVDRVGHLTSYSSDVMLTGTFTDKPFYVLYKPDALSTQGERFNVIATLRTSPYMNAESTDASDANSKKLPKIEEIDSANQAVISSKEFTKYDTTALDFFQHDSESFDATRQITKKEISIHKYKLTGAEYTLYDQVRVDCRVAYYDNTGADPYTRELFSGTFGRALDEEGIPSGDLSSNIYLFYRRTAPNEIITINDESDIGTHKVYLIMQDDAAEGAALTINNTILKIMKGEELMLEFDENTDLNEDGNIESTVNSEYNLVTNMTSTGDVGHIYNEEARTRVYDVDISLVRDATEYAHLHSTKEAKD